MKLFLPLLLICFSFGCKKSETISENISESKPTTQLIENPTDFYEKLSNAAISIIDPEVVYTPDYVGIKYPNGDVPAKTGVFRHFSRRNDATFRRRRLMSASFRSRPFPHPSDLGPNHSADVALDRGRDPVRSFPRANRYLPVRRRDPTSGRPSRSPAAATALRSFHAAQGASRDAVRGQSHRLRLHVRAAARDAAAIALRRCPRRR